MKQFLTIVDIMPPKQSLEKDVKYPGKIDSEILYIPIFNFTCVPEELPENDTG